MERLGPQDASFLYLETARAPQHVGGVAILDPSTVPGGRLTRGALLEALASRLHLAPRLRQRVALPPLPVGRPVWVDDPRFDLGSHVRAVALPPPAGRRELARLVEDLVARPLDRRRPLWEVVLVEEVERGLAALVAKLHHAMVDGLGAMDLAAALFGPAPGRPPAAPEPQEPGPAPSPACLLARGLRDELAQPLRVGLGLARRALLDPAGLGVEAGRVLAGLRELLAGGVLAPPGPFNRRVGPDRRWAMAQAPVRTLREVGEALGGTVNDVVLAAVAGALYRWLRAHGEPTRGRCLRALVPVSLRREGAGPTFGSRVSAILVDLPVGPMGARRRLQLVREQTARRKASGQASGVALLVGMGSWAPTPVHALAARVAGRLRFVNLAVSNVPGPEVPLSVAGARVLAHHPVLPLAEGMGLSVGCTSLAGTMGFGITATPEALPDVEALAAGLEEAVEELRQAAGRRGAGR